MEGRGPIDLGFPWFASIFSGRCGRGARAFGVSGLGLPGFELGIETCKTYSLDLRIVAWLSHVVAGSCEHGGVDGDSDE